MSIDYAVKRISLKKIGKAWHHVFHYTKPAKPRVQWHGFTSKLKAFRGLHKLKTEAKGIGRLKQIHWPKK